MPKITAEGFMAVRKSPEGYEYPDLSTMSGCRDTASEKAQMDNDRMKEFFSERPVQRVVLFSITEVTE